MRWIAGNPYFGSRREWLTDRRSFKSEIRMGINAANTGRKRRRRLKKPVKRILIFMVLALMAGLLYPLIRKLSSNQEQAFHGSAKVEKFRDLNELHLRFGRAHGITPIKTEKQFHTQINELLKKKRLTKISDNEYYVIKRLTHSHPYLVPEAAQLLDLIGKRFQRKLQDQNMDRYLFRVTSVLRTEESQKSLGRRNRNATVTSAHGYGTTFDITYNSLVRKSLFGSHQVISDPAGMTLLSQTIRELRAEKRLVVVTERKEPCFHITVR